METRPFYKRKKPKPQNTKDFEGHIFSKDKIFTTYNKYINLINQHLPPYQKIGDTFPENLAPWNAQFDGRAAAAVFASIGNPLNVRSIPAIITVQKTVRENFNGIDYDQIYYYSGYVDDDGTFDPDHNNYNFNRDLLQAVDYLPHFPTVANPSFRYYTTSKCLAAMAYADYFPDSDPDNNADPFGLRSKVSESLMEAREGWCGSIGPDGKIAVDFFYSNLVEIGADEGNYDMGQVLTLIPIVYGFYDELTSAAQERLISVLLAKGMIKRLNVDNLNYTSGKLPEDWFLAGNMVIFPVPETENHVLMIATARYLTNQLLYQRNQDPAYDNRRNGENGQSCTSQLLGLLHNYLKNDFAEYNAKNYQEETRRALLNLSSYAYDAEVHLGARMVLDYISAHIAVSSNDLRRMVPFRRRNEGANSRVIANDAFPLPFMDVSLLDSSGADPMSPQFALLAGNTRAYRKGREVRPNWAIRLDYAPELVLGAVSDYRIPPSIHDLFVNDKHRRFFQRLHRRWMENEPGSQRNCENMEIFASSPSYLITAGGKPAQWVIPGKGTIIGAYGYAAQNLGVAVPISFMPTGLSAGINVNPNDTKELIQISYFSDDHADDISNGDTGGNYNYGVAPDFACGYGYWLPPWTGVPNIDGIFFFNSQDRKCNSLRQLANLAGLSTLPISAIAAIQALGFSFPFSFREHSSTEPAGFYLAITIYSKYILLEAFDTWLNPDVTFEDFQKQVKKNNPDIVGENLKNYFASAREAVYKTYNGNTIHFQIWMPDQQICYHKYGSRILNIEYGNGNAYNTLKDARNYSDDPKVNPYQFLIGTIMKSDGEGKVEFNNPLLGQGITLDWSDPNHLIRTAEDGTMEHAGKDSKGLYEVWVDFSWNGVQEGDFFHPCNSMSQANEIVADGGVIKIMPGGKRGNQEKTKITKRVTITAPLREVVIQK